MIIIYGASSVAEPTVGISDTKEGKTDIISLLKELTFEKTYKIKA